MKRPLDMHGRLGKVPELDPYIPRSFAFSPTPGQGRIAGPMVLWT
jgi:hypothetical protein